MKIYRYNDIAPLNPYPVTDWKHYFFQYLCTREGFMLTVYKDIYDYYTVGIGHLVTAGDGIPKQVGYNITKQQVVDLFVKDFDRLKISKYTNEIFNANPFKKIGLASFLWAHGYGDYDKGQTRLLIKSSEDEKMIRAKVDTWDRAKPVNQVRNKADFDMFFTGISNHASGLLDFRKIYNFIKKNPATSTGLASLIVFFCSLS